MISEHRKKLIIKTALIQYKEKLEKNLERNKKSLNKFCENNHNLIPRTGIRGGRNTTVTGKIDQRLAVIESIKKEIAFLEGEIEKYV